MEEGAGRFVVSTGTHTREEESVVKRVDGEVHDPQ